MSEPEPESPIRIQRSEEREGSTRFSPEDALSLFTQSLDLTLRKHKEELFKEIDTRIGAKEAESAELEKTLKLIQKDSPALAIQYLEKSIKALKERNKLLRIADKYGWDVVDEYIDDPITEGTDDATKLRQADYRVKAKRRDKVRTRPTPYIPEPESSQVPQDEPFRKTSSASTREAILETINNSAAHDSQTRTDPASHLNQNEYLPVHNQQTGVITAMARVTGPITAQRDVGSNQPRPVVLQEQSDETVKYNLSPFISHDQDFEFECSSASLFE
ncbi:unnamed protein product [Mytilus edulis]|uniref:Uncharacterized protein n=1 Tax=Mytilus edulis TaxID=6550 RepID=A0A8S3R760_MYTED|nr:unnamed protein product [Mytilus edulis]